MALRLELSSCIFLRGEVKIFDKNIHCPPCCRHLSILIHEVKRSVDSKWIDSSWTAVMMAEKINNIALNKNIELIYVIFLLFCTIVKRKETYFLFIFFIYLLIYKFGHFWALRAYCYLGLLQKLCGSNGNKINLCKCYRKLDVKQK